MTRDSDPTLCQLEARRCRKRVRQRQQNRAGATSIPDSVPEKTFAAQLYRAMRISAINVRVAHHECVPVTTLIKRMAEDLTDYLREHSRSARHPPTSAASAGISGFVVGFGRRCPRIAQSVHSSERAKAIASNGGSETWS
jgi:hypothetical protein